MLFNQNSQVVGKHAFLAASKYSWLNYDEDKLARLFTTQQAAAHGTRLHDFAAEAIRLRQKFPATRKTLNLYVNDAIGYRMTPEQPLYYSDNCFGTADAISFRRNELRVHDLKTGVTETSFKQLDIYAALFCLEYRMRPFDIRIELRIYQNDECRIFEPEPEEIFAIMEKIKHFDKIINEMRMEALS